MSNQERKLPGSLDGKLSLVDHGVRLRDLFESYENKDNFGNTATAEQLNELANSFEEAFRLSGRVQKIRMTELELSLLSFQAATSLFENNNILYNGLDITTEELEAIEIYEVEMINILMKPLFP